MLFFQKNSSFKKTPWVALKSLVSFSSSLSPHFGVQFLLAFYAVHSTQRDRQKVSSLLCCYRYSTPLGFQVLPVVKPSLNIIFFLAKSSGGLFSINYKNSSFSSSSSAPCFCLTCSLFLSCTLTRLWGAALFLSSQVVDEGGIQRQSAAWLGGLGSLGGPLVLSPFHCCLFFPFSWGFSSYLPRVTTHAHTHELTGNRL